LCASATLQIDGYYGPIERGGVPITGERMGTLTNAPVCKGAPSEIRGLD